MLMSGIPSGLHVLATGNSRGALPPNVSKQGSDPAKRPHDHGSKREGPHGHFCNGKQKVTCSRPLSSLAPGRRPHVPEAARQQKSGNEYPESGCDSGCERGDATALALTDVPLEDPQEAEHVHTESGDDSKQFNEYPESGCDSGCERGDATALALTDVPLEDPQEAEHVHTESGSSRSNWRSHGSVVIKNQTNYDKLFRRRGKNRTSRRIKQQPTSWRLKQQQPTSRRIKQQPTSWRLKQQPTSWRLKQQPTSQQLKQQPTPRRRKEPLGVFTINS